MRNTTLLCVGELVLHDSAGDFLLVHGNDEFLSLARRAGPSGEVPLVRFSPEHASILAAALEVVMAEPDAGALEIRAAVDELKVALVDSVRGRRVQVANLSRRRPGTNGPESLDLDRHVVAATVAALRGPRLAPLGPPRRGEVMQERGGRVAGVESDRGRTTVSSRTERMWARASFPDGLRRVVAACLAMVVGNPGETAIRVAHVSRAGEGVLIERVATASGGFPYVVANVRPGRPARPRRTVRLTEEMAAWVIRRLARDDDPVPIDGPLARTTPDPPPLLGGR